MIRIVDLRKSFGSRVIFDNLNMEIRPGEIVGVYGPSGTGKSTLAKVLCGVMPPDEGRIYLENHLIYASNTRYDRKRGMQIQMVYQQPYSALDGVQKIGKGFQELCRYHHLAKTPQEEHQKIEQILSEVGLDLGILQYLPHQISGGEAQRISIAKALLFQPKLLILDEATSMLDVSTQANVLGLVKRVILPKGGSLLLISHDWDLVQFLCDQIYVFDNSILKKEK